MMKERILTNTIINSSGKFLSFIFQLFIITYLIKNLGNDSYGLVVLALSLTGNIGLLESGFGLAVTKYVAEYNAKNEWKQLKEIINTNFIVTTILAVIFCFVLIIVNEFFLEKIFNIPEELLTDSKNLIRILILLSFFEFLSLSIIRVAEGFQKYTLLRSIELAKWFLRAVFVFIAIISGYSLIGVGLAYLIAGILTFISLFVFVFVKDVRLKIDLRSSNKKSFKMIFGFSVWIMLSKFFFFLSYRVDTILIGILLPIDNLAYYNIAFKIYEILRYGFSLISSTIVPVTSELNAKIDINRLVLLFKKASKYTMMIMYPQLVFFLFYVGNVINIWIGDGFGTSVLLSQLFIVSILLGALISSGSEMMVGLNRVKDFIIFAGIGSIVKFIVSVLLIREIGVYSVRVGSIVGGVIIVTGYLYLILMRFNITFSEFTKDTVLKPAICSIVLGSILFIIPKNLYAGIIVLLSIYIYMFIYMVDKTDKETIKLTLKTMFPI